MSRKKVLIAGATGLVGYAAMKHFAAEPGCEVVAVSRRCPDDTYGARFIALDLTDAAQCAKVASELSGVTHLVYAALYERPGLVAGWQEAEQIRINDLMLRNLFEPLEKAAPELRHVALLQGTKAYGVHVRPAGGAGTGKPLGDARAAELLLEPGKLPSGQAAGQGLALVDPAASADRG
jgi:NAD(P)-dependent dehydrogenase (short-subunit alcohol dehydrogenase family)